MRPALDTPRGARFLTPALITPPPVAARIAAHERAYLAATLATALDERGSDGVDSTVRRRAIEAQTTLELVVPLAARARLIDLAEAVRDVMREELPADRVPLVAAIVRDLLDGAPASCVLLDRAVRDACERRYVPTAEHRACAARIVAEVLA